MINRVFNTALLVSLVSKFYHCDDARERVIEVHKSVASKVTSAVFPNFCCEKENYLFHSADSSSPYLYLMFSDLDLPKDAKIMVYDGINSSSQPFFEQPLYHNGIWTRPAIVSSGSDIYMTLAPGKRHSYNHVGFRAIVRSSKNQIWSTDHPYTVCPTIIDAMDGGSIRLHNKPTRSLNREIHMMYDCVWQIKVHREFQNLRIFVRITSINLVDGHLIVRKGTSSFGSVVANISSYTSPTPSLQMNDLHQNNGFISDLITTKNRTGIYMSIVKPLNEGTFAFTYGVFQETSATNSKCYLKTGDVAYNGFKCLTYPWCVPLEYKCDGVIHCPDGSDESDKYCSDLDFVTALPVPSSTISSSTSKPCVEVTCKDGSCSKFNQDCEENCRLGETWCLSIRECRSVLTYLGTTYNLCDDEVGDCGRYEKQCDNNDCVHFWETCPTTVCNTRLERECDDGTCISLYGNDVCSEDCLSSQRYCPMDKTCVDSNRRCADGTCPSYKQACGHDGCAYSSDFCDGSWDCPNGEDEEDCYDSEDGGFGMSIFYIVFAVFIVLTLIALIRYGKSNKNSSGNRQNNDNEENGGEEERRSLTVRAQTGNGARVTTTITPSNNTPAPPTVEEPNVESNPQPTEPPPSYDEAVAISVPSHPPDSALPTYDSLTRNATIQEGTL